MSSIPVVFGFLLEYTLGYSRSLPHPVALLGRLIARGETILRRFIKSPLGEIIAGIFLTVVVVAAVYLGPKLLLELSARVLPAANFILATVLIWTSLASRSLVQHMEAVAVPLTKGDLGKAREQVGKIVGRDTHQLEEAEIARAAVETGAESLADGIIAPLFYALLGGAPLAWGYKAVNTLDSMIGYKNSSYIYMGRAAARLDDIVNYIPARLTAVFLILAGKILSLEIKKGWQVVLKDSRKQPSPNSGYPEGAAAGLLNLRLGGKVSYAGKITIKSYLNEEGKSPTGKDIYAMVKLIKLTSILFLSAGLLITWVLNYFL